MRNDLEPPLIVYVDVDDTLVRTFGTKRIPLGTTVGHIKALAADGAVLYCWSSGGRTTRGSSRANWASRNASRGSCPNRMS